MQLRTRKSRNLNTSSNTSNITMYYTVKHITTMSNKIKTILNTIKQCHVHRQTLQFLREDKISWFCLFKL